MAARRPGSPFRMHAIGCLVAAVLAAAVGPAAADAGGQANDRAAALSAQATPAAASDVVAQWNAISVRTISAEGMTPIPAAPLYLSFTSVAMYDAAVAIEGGFEPYALRRRPAGSRHASGDVAVATAAYTVLRTYFPASTANLDADYAAALAQVPDGRAKDLGISVGEAAAKAIIALRVDDGRGAAVTLEPSFEPGEWRPTPPAMAPMLVPWLGFVRPLVLRSPTQIRLPGPDDLDSRAYARDFREVKAMGAVDSTARTPAQTETALFWNDNAVAQYQAGMRGIVGEHRLGLVRGARTFALVNTAMADAVISCWRVKYDTPYWRPITAIVLADTDGNPATTPDPTWTPLVTTPPYPEYPSGHACITGSVSRGLSHLFGSRNIDLDVSSAVTGTSRHYDTAAELDRETMDARIWLGLHFRAAMTDGNRLGQRSADYVASHEFRRARH